MRLPTDVAQVIAFSTMGRIDFAFASVVVMRSCSISDETMFENMAWRGPDLRPNFLPCFWWRMTQFPFRNGEKGDYALPRIVGGTQPSSFMPRLRPISARISLISFSDLRP